MPDTIKYSEIDIVKISVAHSQIGHIYMQGSFVRETKQSK